MNTENPSPSEFELSPTEKLQLVEDLWDELAANPSNVPVHDWQIDEVNRRAADLRKYPSSGLTWDDVNARIRE